MQLRMGIWPRRYTKIGQFGYAGLADVANNIFRALADGVGESPDAAGRCHNYRPRPAAAVGQWNP